MDKKRGTAALLVSMLIFSTVGLAAKLTDLPSGVKACARGYIGALTILLFALLTRRKRTVYGKDVLYLLLSGACIGANWILLFESYRFTSVATATVCYYLAPVFVVLLAIPIFKEKLTLRGGLCVLAALVGTAFLSGLKKPDFSGEMKGMLLAAGAAVLYAAATLINKHPRRTDVYSGTVLQMTAAGTVLLPYALFVDRPWTLTWSIGSALGVVLLGIIHTGLAYLLFFYAVPRLEAGRVSLLSYVDPFGAVVLSFTVLREPVTWYGLVGATLVLGAAVVGSLEKKKA